MDSGQVQWQGGRHVDRRHHEDPAERATTPDGAPRASRCVPHGHPRAARRDPRSARRLDASPTQGMRAGYPRLTVRNLPPIAFPESLPVSARRDEIARALREHPVIIVCGETGSGKTTQLPKIALALGRGLGAGGTGLIGHTQPRRIAARASPSASRRSSTRRSARWSATRCASRTGSQPGAVGQADDRRHPAGRDAERPAAARLRHPHHRRGARAQPEHRFPARLPAAAAAAPAGPEGHRHLGHHRRRPLREHFAAPRGPRR